MLFFAALFYARITFTNCARKPAAYNAGTNECAVLPMITDQMLTDYAMPVLVAGLMVFMIIIVYQTGKQSGAGKFGMFVMFLGLMVGVLGFALKFVIQYIIESSGAV